MVVTPWEAMLGPWLQPNVAALDAGVEIHRIAGEAGGAGLGPHAFHIEGFVSTVSAQLTTSVTAGGGARTAFALFMDCTCMASSEFFRAPSQAEQQAIMNASEPRLVRSRIGGGVVEQVEAQPEVSQTRTSSSTFLSPMTCWAVQTIERRVATLMGVKEARLEPLQVW